MRKKKYENITLIGMPGVGKSFFGKKLAKRLGYQFLDVDKIIEKRVSLGLQEVIDKYGEKELLKIEEEAVLNLGHINNHVISPGGSIVYSKKAMLFLKEISRVVFLYSSLDDIEKHLLDLNTRGIVGLKEKSLKALYKERNILYKKYADIIIEVLDNFDVATLLKHCKPS